MFTVTDTRPPFYSLPAALRMEYGKQNIKRELILWQQLALHPHETPNESVQITYRESSPTLKL